MKAIYIFISLLITCFDQIIKRYVRSIFDINQNDIFICDYISIIKVWNLGVSFGLFNNLIYGKIIFSFIAILIVLIILYYMYKSTNTIYSIAYSLIIGGAIGNIVDRIQYGAVFDFIDIHVNDWHWPAFNLADVFIVLGILIMIFGICIKDIDNTDYKDIKSN